MERLAAHPSREELSAYSLGQLPEEKAVAIDSHISECEPCCETIVELSSEDTFAALLQEAGRLPTDQTADHESVTSKSPSDPDEIPPPLTEHPRYEVLGLIGKGGMGDVYKARHRKMERTVALKVINHGLVRKAKAVDRFHREVKAAAQLSHPNIVTAYDADQAGDFHFMVMEYVDGVDLSQKVKDRGALPIAEACDYIRQAAIGLQHAHECGMVHRDIKPHNLMVTSDGTVKILDFGLASLAPETLASAETAEARSDLTAAGAIMGTPDFISPEQADDARKADIRSDIYSLGATLFFVLTGRPLFTEGDVASKLRSHAEVEPETLDVVLGDVPDGLASIVSRMIAKDPDERFQTAAEVATALQPYCLDAKGASTTPAAEPQSPRRRGPFSWFTGIATGLFALLVAAAVYFIITDNGVVRIEVLDDSLQVEIDGREVTLSEDGEKVQTFRAGDHEIVVRLGETELVTDEFELRRNGEVRFRVTVEEGQVVVSQTGEPPKTAALPGTKVAANWPELRITNAGVDSTGLGQITRAWKLSSRKVGTVTARLVHVTEGKIQVANERRIDLSHVAGESEGLLRFDTQDQPEDRAAVSIEMTLTPAGEIPPRPFVSEAKPLVVDKRLVSSSMTKTAKWDGYGLDENEVVLVHWSALLPKAFEDLQHGDDLASMVEASKKGASFVVLTLDWVGRYGEETPPLTRSDLTLLQGDWETVSVTEGGTQLAIENGFGGLLLQIKDDTFVITERNPDGEETEVDTGRIEINSKATPKTIDFIGRAERRLGIYELRYGVLRVCLVEYGGTDSPRGERISDGNPVTRPTTFESPPGSNMMLLEFHRKSDNDLQTTEDARSLPLVQVLHDAEGLTAKRVKIIGTFLVTDDKFGVRTYQISTAQEDLPPPPDEDAYKDREVTFEASFDEEKILNVGQFHNKRVLVTGPIYFFPSDSDSPAKVIFMMDGIYEYPSQTSKTKQPQEHFQGDTNGR